MFSVEQNIIYVNIKLVHLNDLRDHKATMNSLWVIEELN